jgi:hypothetical protein
MNTLYDTLGVRMMANKDEIEHAFTNRIEAISKKAGRMAAADAEMVNAAGAYAILKEPDCKAEYDRMLQSGQPVLYHQQNITQLGMQCAGIIDQANIGLRQLTTKKDILIGLLLLLLGVGITGGSYLLAVARGGGTYIISYGLIIAGCVGFFGQLFKAMKGRGKGKQIKAAMWGQLHGRFVTGPLSDLIRLG